MSNQSNNAFIGRVIGKYEILEEAGHGGMATVYKGRDRFISRSVAIKILPPHFLHDPDFFERFKREVDVISSLEHPHILPIYDYGRTNDGIPYLIMRFMGGGTIEQLAGLEDISRLSRPLRQIGQGLDYAHRSGVIHRDLKPGNIMLDEDGNAYLTDFGIARVADSKLTGSGIIGTPHYMSPEQISGEDVTYLADIYSMGIVLFELLTGEQPYKSESVPTVLLKHMHEELPSLELYREDIPHAVESVLLKATAKNPENRYQTVSELVDDYVQALSGSTIRTTAAINAAEPSDTNIGTGSSTFSEGMSLSLMIEGHDEPLQIHIPTNQPTLILGRTDEDYQDVNIDFRPYRGFEEGVSRRHAAINYDRKRQSLELWDLGSSNGTYLNGMRLSQGQRYQLRDGDGLRLSMLKMNIYFIS